VEVVVPMESFMTVETAAMESCMTVETATVGSFMTMETATVESFMPMHSAAVEATAVRSSATAVVPVTLGTSKSCGAHQRNHQKPLEQASLHRMASGSQLMT
jgi:hypothetical protein